MKFIITFTFFIAFHIGAFSQSFNSAHFIDSLLLQMTIEEKAGQLSLFTNDWNDSGDMIQDQYVELIKDGKVGGIFNAHGAAYTRKLQEMAVNESRLGIPLLFGFDVIHGHHTIFPVPLAESSSWDLEAIERSARIAALEASATGLHWVFAPMCDISRDPRWGRVMEGAGEDPFLASAIAAARVKGFQGEGFVQPDAVAACVKHFAAYGAPQAGREYHSVDMSELTLREFYLPPYKAAVDAGAFTVMSAFNDLNGIPATANSFLLQKILRDEWNFRGFVVSDFTSVLELLNHGTAENASQATLTALSSGTEMDMQAFFYLQNIPQLVNKGFLEKSVLDAAVRKVLQLKYELGLFNDPFRFCSVEREQKMLMKDEFLEASRDMARKSMVLLKNDASLLPLSKRLRKVALIGPLADSRQDMLGGWYAAGDGKKAVSLLDGLKSKLPDCEITFTKGCDIVAQDEQDFDTAIKLASEAELVILALGEPAWMTGEATSRTSLDLPGMQQELADKILSLGKKVVVVLFNGRPLTINKLDQNASTILEAWYPGTMAGSALADVLFGEYNPSGKLPMTFPRSVGQIPVFYNTKNTGRPWDGATNTTSRYIDSPNEPLYCFGFGLSYTSFIYGDLSVDKNQIIDNELVTATIELTNTGKFAGEEIVQLYIRDLVSSVSPALKNLKGFQKIMLQPGETKLVQFKIGRDDLAFYNKDLKRIAEPGEFEIMIGTDSMKLKTVRIRLL